MHHPTLPELERFDAAIRFRAARQQMILEAGRQILEELDKTLQK